MDTPRCTCPCHSYSGWQVARDALPSIDAVTACDSCINAHCAVLIERRVWYDPTPDVLPYIEPPRPAVGGCDGEWTGEDGG